MNRSLTAVFALLTLVLVPAAEALGASWSEGSSYTVLAPPQRTHVAPGKIEVMEVFSYGCVACNNVQPTVEQLKKRLPANAEMVFLPAAFIPSEDWLMFQRAFFTAQNLGIAERTHQAIFDAIWKSGELAIIDPVSHRLKSPQPTLQDAARCYARLTGIKPQAFLDEAKSFDVDRKIRAADEQVETMQVSGTPCFVVNGKYRINGQTLHDGGELIDLVTYLVNKESPQKTLGGSAKSRAL